MVVPGGMNIVVEWRVEDLLPAKPEDLSFSPITYSTEAGDVISVHASDVPPHATAMQAPVTCELYGCS